MKVNPYRAAAGAAVSACAVIILIFIGMLVWSAIVDHWWRGALQWIGVIVALLVFGYVSSSWETWEYEWDQRNAPKPKLCEHGKEINEEEVNCLECMGVPSDNPDDELRDCHD